MAELTTSHTPQHTLRLDAEELIALRVAAEVALGYITHAPEDLRRTWRSFATLGRPESDLPPDLLRFIKEGI
ncbi:hypothetical protein [Streptomyces sp. NPDC086838]|uniref:hypothetical protein n=1 Tax=Streptomyces sp. NPDC086838 TaxID=3365762 RepID=UPI003801E50A